MVVHSEYHILFPREPAHLVEAARDERPFLLGINRLVAKDAHGLALDAVALLRGSDHLCAQRVEKIAVLDESFDRRVISLGEQGGGEPDVADLQPADCKLLLERFDIFWIFVADLAAGKTAERHLADALLKGILRAEVGQVVVRPRDRRDGQADFVCVQHWYTTPLYCMFNITALF